MRMFEVFYVMLALSYNLTTFYKILQFYVGKYLFLKISILLLLLFQDVQMTGLLSMF